MENLGDVRSMLLGINEQVEDKHSFLKELTEDSGHHPLFRVIAVGTIRTG